MSTTAWAMLTALVALAGSLATVMFTLVPSLKPDPREQVGAALSVFAVEPNVTIADWAQRAFPGPRSLRAEYKRVFGTASPRADLLLVTGDVVYVNTQVDGYKHQSVSLQWSVYDSQGCRRAHGQCRVRYDLIAGAPPVADLRIDAPSRRSVQLIFVPAIGDLPTAGTFVRIELREPHGLLAVVDTPLLRHGVPVLKRGGG